MGRTAPRGIAMVIAGIQGDPIRKFLSSQKECLNMPEQLYKKLLISFGHLFASEFKAGLYDFEPDIMNFQMKTKTH